MSWLSAVPGGTSWVGVRRASPGRNSSLGEEQPLPEPLDSDKGDRLGKLEGNLSQTPLKKKFIRMIHKDQLDYFLKSYPWPGDLNFNLFNKNLCICFFI